MGTSWVAQNIVAKNPDAELRVYAVWIPMQPTDARSEWDRTVIDDPRVRHFWDGDRILGEKLGRLVDFPGPVMWDAYVVYEPGARWGDPAAGAGWTVIGESERLRNELEPLLS